MPKSTKLSILPEVVNLWLKEAEERDIDPYSVPMAAMLGDTSFDDDDWLFEIKSRKNIALKQFDDVGTELQEKMKFNAVLDGEITVLDDEGYASFQLIQSWQIARKGFLTYKVFDILWLEGYDLTKLPLYRRKQILEYVLPQSDEISYSDHVEGHGNALFNLIAEHNLEGIIAKKKRSKYYPGERSKDWLKIKNKQKIEAVVCGMTPGKGNDLFGSLVLGEYQNGKLVYVGRNSSRFDRNTASLFHKVLTPLISTKCPFNPEPKLESPVTWVKPQLIVEVKFTERTVEGYLRHPIIEGVRNDKTIEEIMKESLLK